MKIRRKSRSVLHADEPRNRPCSIDTSAGFEYLNLAGKPAPRCARTATLALAVACFALGLTWHVSAQAITDPQIVEFVPSPDHWATDTDGSQILTQYALEIYEIGAFQPYQVVSIGKPLPDADGKIRVGLGASLSSWPPPPLTNYELRVAAVGPLGSGESDPSNAFSFTGPCTFAVAWGTQSFGAAGGSGTVGVTTGTGCTWSAAAEAAWVTLASSGRTGSGTVTFTVAPNVSGPNRTTYLNVATQSVALKQVGVPCSFTTSPASQSVPSSGGVGSVAVTAPAGCGWTVASDVAWITPGAGGDGSGTVSYTVASNATSSLSRTGTLTVAGKPVTITQVGVPCTFATSTASQYFPASGGTGSVVVTTPTGCAWTASSDGAWITPGAGGTGSGTVNYTVVRNVTSPFRTGTLTVAGRPVTISQGGVVLVNGEPLAYEHLRDSVSTHYYTVTVPSCMQGQSGELSFIIGVTGGQTLQSQAQLTLGSVLAQLQDGSCSFIGIN